MKAEVKDDNVATARDVLTTAQAAEYLAVSHQFLEIARLRGSGPSYCKVGRLVRYRRVTLDAWLASREVSSTSENV
ncbi:MAG: hypothetical protein A3G81_05290 [Betaproteobacteria bacterium RIFCSPLOWO2_12_FULL_65_14]|nr:MAG: hypothetical protein A3G81_05290 [Betaproteobacteria bacterium RIFCSPLOWO2_12_FULL_65_14]